MVSRSFCNFSMLFLFVIILCCSGILRNIAQSLLTSWQKPDITEDGINEVDRTDDSLDSRALTLTKVTGNFMLTHTEHVSKICILPNKCTS
jgi:hypothetical protein